ncbi:MAG TPA: hypothetical protein VFR97_08780 [Capillimicrobium sp.]|nr:hypothetical protein [Capillimicrobium sp.]
MADEPTTEQLRAIQGDRARREAEQAQEAEGSAERRTHQRRADKAAYLRDKLAEQEESERD